MVGRWARPSPFLRLAQALAQGISSVCDEKSTCPVTAASSDGRRNTIQCVDSTLLPGEKRSVWLFSVKT